MKLKSGSIVCIPLMHDMGYTFAKYIDLRELKKDVLFPDLLKFYDLRSLGQAIQSDLNSVPYLLNPMACAGLRPTIRAGTWTISGEVEVLPEDLKLPEFKSGNSSYEEVDKGEWFLHVNVEAARKTKCNYDQVRYLQPYAAVGTGTIEMRLTMYHILNERLTVDGYFDLDDDLSKWNYKQVQDSPAIRGSGLQ